MADIVVLTLKQKSDVLSASDLSRCVDFGKILRTAMFHSIQQMSIELSSLPQEEIGDPNESTDTQKKRISRFDGAGKRTMRRVRYFTSSKVYKTDRMVAGYCVEERTQLWFEQVKETGFQKGPTADGVFDYLYNDDKPYKEAGFPIDFRGKIGDQGARPDWRLKLEKGEALFDATSKGQAGHLALKKVGSRTLDQLPDVLYLAEIVYEDSDFYPLSPEPSDAKPSVASGPTKRSFGKFIRG